MMEGVDEEGWCYVLKAIVNPSQEAPEKIHQAWIAVRHDGLVVTAHCTCMAG